MGFSKSQSEAICHNKGPMMVLAGPGSGKTLVITHRTKYLIEKCGVNPANILVITFTKAAATEMKERFENLMGYKLPVSFGTFHAVFFKILKIAYGFSADNIIREEIRNEYLRDIINKFDLDIDDENDFINGIAGEISLIKNDGIRIENYYSTNCPEDIFRKIFVEYSKRLKMARLIDFDDMLVYCYDLFKQRPDILSAWQKKYEYILIDEFQDINRIQYEIIKMLALPNNNLFIVGDDDQSIYRFRGSKPEIMLNFTKEFDNAKSVLLDNNYRSCKNIVEHSLNLIANNKSRFEKKINANNEKNGNIEIKTFKTQQDENMEVINQIKKLQNQGKNFSDIAILYRTNTQPRMLIEKLIEYNVPFKMRDTVPNIYEHWITKNIISYINIATGSRERKEFLKIINRPKRYINREALSFQEVSFEALLDYYKDKDWMCERINKLWHDIKMLKDMPPYAAINYIRHVVGYEEYLVEYAQFRKIKPEELLEILDEIQETAKPFKTYGEWFIHMDNYAKELQIKNRKKNEVHNSVLLATMHSSKGLEFDTVFVIDVNEGITPYKKALLDEDMEEERRMFYVAITRAKENLYVYSIQNRLGKDMEVSRYVGEMLINSSELRENARIHHVKYGDGKIKAVENTSITIVFDDKRIIKLNKDFCVRNRLIKIIE